MIVYLSEILLVAHTTLMKISYAQSDQSICKSLAYSMNIKLLTEHLLEFLSLKGGCIGSPESSLDKMPHCCK